MKTILSIFFISFSLLISGQTKINGYVKSENGEALPGVNIFLENTYDGASSGENGDFSFSTDEKGIFLLKATFIGYKSWEKEVDLSEDIYVEIILKESVNTLDAVIITAGSFAASDESRASVMKSLDVYTTPTANGDIMAAMKTMPGNQAASDDGRLLVRGGDVYETQTYIDGLVAAKPYFSKTPDVATRGRFAPSLFSGVSFNSGGYSAEYGQALSSVLVLNSNDLAENDNTGLSIMSIGGEVNKTKRWTKSSLMLSGGYTNLSAYDKVFNSSIDWEKPVQAVNGTAVFRHKTSSRGMFKGYITTDWGNLSYFVPAAKPDELMRISNKGTTVYSNLSYRDCFSDKSCYKIGVSSTIQNNKLGLDFDNIQTLEMNVETRFSVFHDVSDGVKITWGANETYNKYDLEYKPFESTSSKLDFDDHLLGGFIESEIKFSRNLAIRPGIRSEYSSVLNKWNFAPRFALALKTGKEAQVSGAWGLYHQTPQADYLRWETSLDFERAYHYVLSYQFGDISKRLFRAEVYYKTYNRLVTYSGDNEYQISNIQNSGTGYAGGIDIFWRDLKSIKGFDYWITYSYIDTKRKYQNYPEKVTPWFVSDHNFSFVGKYWVNQINTQFGLSFTAASGRPYNNINSDEFMAEKTKPYSDLSLNLSHVFYIGDQYSVLYCSVNNVLGNDNTLSYRPSNLSDAQGNYTMIPVKRDLKRMVFIGLFLNF
ncbi:TonB-dependent receptor [Maribellus comscasis]|nr:carboxypeptidase-like regulatory domain-containing protein [Maribellus comscasis]